MVIAIAALAVTLLLAALLAMPRVIHTSRWRAIATPLASIIGSGFLVTVPILRDLAGAWSVGLMIGLLVLAYLIGAAIRNNIRHVEPLLENGEASLPISSLERMSHLVLAFAYFVSVAYYLVLFSTFLLKPFGIADEFLVKLVVTACLTLIGTVGLLRGFAAVERLEIYAVSLKLAVIGGLLAGLSVYGVALILGEGISTVPGHFEMASLPVLLGLLIVVQGFETSRFLGNAYEPEMRAETMKQAQIIAGFIYVAFFVAMIPLLGVSGRGDGVAAIVDMLQPVSMVLPLLIIVGALASQSSAAIADTLGAGGLVHDITGHRVKVRHTYPVIAIVAGIVTWETDIYALITLASRCFAFYYALQCVVATLSAMRQGKTHHAAGYAILAVVCAAVVTFGAPVEGG